MATTVRFVETDPIGLPLKRKQVAQACERCRKRKKRCTHTESLVHESPSSPSSATRKPTLVNDRPSASPGPSDRKELPAVQDGSVRPDSQRDPNYRYIGDLNPGAILMEATNLCSHRDTSRRSVGTWHSHFPRQETQMQGIPNAHSESRRAVQDMMKSYLWNHCLLCRPPAADFAVLKKIYFEKLNMILPFFEPESLSHPPDAVTGILIEQVVSLAAAADPEATRHLRLSATGSALSRQEFCACLSNSVLTALDVGLVTNRIWIARLSAALSLYTQPMHPEDADIPAQLNSRAVHQMHTLGVHMAREEDNPAALTMQTLFCVLWALDRLTSALYGRACLIHERDVGWDIDEIIRKQAPPFRLLLLLIEQLDNVIALYRPGTRSSTRTTMELPIFEQMIIDAEALKVPSFCLASLEIFYHSVAILSSQSPTDVTTSSLPNPATNSRRSLAADRITALVGEQFTGQLAYMPLIPYGISLSLNVSYRKMRHSKVPMFRSRGKQDFERNMLLLKSMDDTFWSARTTVAMAEQVLHEIDKTVASLAEENGLVDHPRKNEPTSTTSGAHFEASMDVSTGTNAVDGNNFDPVLLNNMPDLDVFGHFDPTFDLGAFDAALEGNLDFGHFQSSNWYDWQQTLGMPPDMQ
ncbi:hypothetical protein F5Y18DRAFT_417664 [Xylariaceae sp. FL1019]|nr:hypothetical protein F5Y18DRAFT_417664 [Xylariaceae sp. FL1019]